MPRDEGLPIIRAFYDLVLWLNPKIAKFPRDQRFVLGEQMVRQLYEILENLIRAKYPRSRRAIKYPLPNPAKNLHFRLQSPPFHPHPKPPFLPLAKQRPVLAAIKNVLSTTCSKLLKS